jgi:hypothetical protein
MFGAATMSWRSESQRPAGVVAFDEVALAI